MKKFVLDACAIIALLRGETGYAIVQQKLEDAAEQKLEIFLHRATILEIYYDSVRIVGQKKADTILSIINAYPVNQIDDLSDIFIKDASYFKTHYKISFADCFVLATAKTNNSTVVTSDHHEFDAIEKNGDLSFEWIR